MVVMPVRLSQQFYKYVFHCFSRQFPLLRPRNEARPLCLCPADPELGAGSSRWLIRLDASARPYMTIAVRGPDATNEAFVIIMCCRGLT